MIRAIRSWLRRRKADEQWRVMFVSWDGITVWRSDRGAWSGYDAILRERLVMEGFQLNLRLNGLSEFRSRGWRHLSAEAFLQRGEMSWADLTHETGGGAG